MAAKQVGVVVLGCGNVGATVLRRLETNAAFYKSRFNVVFNVNAVSDSTGAVVSASKDSHLNVGEVLEWKTSKRTMSTHQFGVASGKELDRRLRSLAGKDQILVDCSATDSTTELLADWVKSGGGIVLANKKPLTGAYENWERLMAGNRCGYESTVGAGTPFIAATQRIVAANDAVHAIQGTFSGTLGFLTSGLDENRPYSELVMDAYKKGYTEPDPRDDLSGMDVARKALILARTIGWRAEMDRVSVESLYPAKFQSLSVPDFLKALPELDAEIAKKNAEAQANGCVLRYVASLHDGVCEVGLKAVPADGPIGQLKGTNNILQVTTDIYKASPLVVKGAGAGADITAAGIVADLISLALS